MKPPTFFISSTVWDFADLRSAIKYTLESRGCTVLASEYSDFRKPLDKNSYEACLRAIEQADYFILLIGSRIGGWYDQNARVSITQQEYRHAYELHKAGRLRIVTLVRREIWDLRENHKALERHLKSLTMDAELRAAVQKYPNKFSDDAEFIVSLIDEVARTGEFKAAMNGESESLPTGNWIHTYSGFRDFIDILNGILMDGLPADQAAFRLTLKSELTDILSACLIKSRGNILSPHSSVVRFNKQFALTKAMVAGRTAVLPAKVWDHFSTWMMSLLGFKASPHVLMQALSSSAFVEFDFSSGQFVETPVFRAIYGLNRELAWLIKGAGADVLQPIFKYSPKARDGYRNDDVEMAIEEIAPLINLAFRWCNVISYCDALIRHLDGAPYVEPELFPWSPVEGMQAELDAEAVTPAEAYAFVHRSA